MACFNIFNNKYKISRKIIKQIYSIIGIFYREHAACIFDVFDIPWILQNLFFLHTSFWREGFLNISNHLPDSSFT